MTSPALETPLRTEAQAMFDVTLARVQETAPLLRRGSKDPCDLYMLAKHLEDFSNRALDLYREEAGNGEAP